MLKVLTLNLVTILIFATTYYILAVSGGDHFNLWAPADAASPAVLGPLILAWVNQQLAVPAAITFEGGGWGNADHDLVDVTPMLSSSR